jgi:hypothetical protein
MKNDVYIDIDEPLKKGNKHLQIQFQAFQDQINNTKNDTPDFYQKIIREFSLLGQLLEQAYPGAYQKFKTDPEFAGELKNLFALQSSSNSISENTKIVCADFLIAWYGCDILSQNPKEKKSLRANFHLSRESCHDIKLGFYPLLSQFNAESLVAYQPSLPFLAAMKKAIRNYRTPSQKILRYINILSAILTMAVVIIASANMVFTLLLGQPVWICYGLLFLITAANLRTQYSIISKTNSDALSEILGFHRIGLTEWLNDQGKCKSLSLPRKLAIYTSLFLSALVGLSTGFFIIPLLVTAAGTLFALPAALPIYLLAALLAGALGLSTAMNLFKNCLTLLKPSSFLAKQRPIEAYFTAEQVVKQAPLRCQIGRNISYSILYTCRFLGVVVGLLIGFVTAQALCNALVSLGLAWTISAVISGSLNIGFVALVQLLATAEKETVVWETCICRVVAQILQVKSPTSEVPNKSPVSYSEKAWLITDGICGVISLLIATIETFMKVNPVCQKANTRFLKGNTLARFAAGADFFKKLTSTSNIGKTPAIETEDETSLSQQMLAVLDNKYSFFANRSSIALLISEYGSGLCRYNID